MLKVQAAPAATVPWHGGSVLLVEKSALLVPLMVAAVKVIGAPLVLVMVTAESTWTPTVDVPKLTGLGVNSTPVPVPASATICGLLASLSVTLIVPVTYPSAVGVKVTKTEQVPPAAISPPLVQVLALALANGPVNDSAGLPRVSVAPVLLVSVILVLTLVVPIACVANVSEPGVNPTVAVPVPVIPTTCGLPGSLSLMTRAPFFAPVAWG